MDLDMTVLALNFSPSNALLNIGTGITAVILLSSINDHAIIGPIFHQVGVEYMVLYKASAKYDSSCCFLFNYCSIEFSPVIKNVYLGCPFSIQKSLVQNLAHDSVLNGSTVNRNTVLIALENKWAFMIDFLSSQLEYLCKSHEEWLVSNRVKDLIEKLR